MLRTGAVRRQIEPIQEVATEYMICNGWDPKRFCVFIVEEKAEPGFRRE
jgi:hypothetical protein